MIAAAPAPLTRVRVAQLAGGDLVVREVPPGAAAREAFLAAGIEGAAIDTRALGPGMLFVPLPGRRADGHDFLAEAFRRGAAAALCARSRYEEWRGREPGPLVVVEDVTEALGRLGHGHRLGWDGLLLCVTGSAGKTTTRELVAAALGTAGPGLRSEGNLNNQWGVPLTLLRLRPEHRSAVVELGTNHPGEIAALAALACAGRRRDHQRGARPPRGLRHAGGGGPREGQPGVRARGGPAAVRGRRLAAPAGRAGRCDGAARHLRAGALGRRAPGARHRPRPGGEPRRGRGLPAPGAAAGGRAPGAQRAGRPGRGPRAGPRSRGGGGGAGRRPRAPGPDGGARGCGAARCCSTATTPIPIRPAPRSSPWPAGRARAAASRCSATCSSSGRAPRRCTARWGRGCATWSCGWWGRTPPTTPPARAAAAWRRGSSTDKPALAAALRAELGPGVVVLLKASRGVALEEVLAGLGEED